MKEITIYTYYRLWSLDTRGYGVFWPLCKLGNNIQFYSIMLTVDIWRYFPYYTAVNRNSGMAQI